MPAGWCDWDGSLMSRRRPVTVARWLLFVFFLAPLLHCSSARKCRLNDLLIDKDTTLPTQLAATMAAQQQKRSFASTTPSDLTSPTISPEHRVFKLPSDCDVIAMGGTGLGDEGMRHLVDLLIRHPEVKVSELHVPTNRLGVRGAHEIFRYFMARALTAAPDTLPHTQLSHSLRLSKPSLTITRASSDTPHEANGGGQHDDGIRVLNLYGNSFGDDGVEVLSRIFKVSTSSSSAASGPIGSNLQTLGLGVNDIGPKGITALATSLADCSACKLKTLGLFRNSFGNDGARALAFMLERNTVQVSSLFIGGSGVQNGGVVAVAQALVRNKHLKVLSVEGGGIGDAGALALASAAVRSKALVQLDIRNCLPTHIGCKHSYQKLEALRREHEEKQLGQSSPAATGDMLELLGSQARFDIVSKGAVAREALETVGWTFAQREDISLLGYTALSDAVRRRSSQSFNGPPLKVIADVDLAI